MTEETINEETNKGTDVWVKKRTIKRRNGYEGFREMNEGKR